MKKLKHPTWCGHCGQRLSLIVSGAVWGGTALCPTKPHNHNTIIITWDRLDSNPNQLCFVAVVEISWCQYTVSKCFCSCKILSLEVVAIVSKVAERSLAAHHKANQSVKSEVSQQQQILHMKDKTKRLTGRSWLTLLYWKWCNAFVPASTAAFCRRVWTCSAESSWQGSLKHGFRWGTQSWAELSRKDWT